MCVAMQLTWFEESSLLGVSDVLEHVEFADRICNSCYVYIYISLTSSLTDISHSISDAR